MARNLNARSAEFFGPVVLVLLLSSGCPAAAPSEFGPAPCADLDETAACATDRPAETGTPLALADRVFTDEDRVVDVAVLENDRDPDGDTLRVVGVTQAANGWVVVNGDDSVRYQPNSGFAGPDGFAYTVADAGGATATATVSVQVNDVPDAPVAENQAVETEEDTAVAIALVASDVDGDPLSFRIQRLPVHGSLRGTPPDVSYVPDADYNGPDEFEFAADDGKEGIDTGTVSIEVRPVDDVPVAADDEAMTDEGRVVDVAVLGNDRDPDGDALRVVGFTQAANGSVVLNGDETIRYQAAVGFTGPDGFAYTIADAGGATATATVSVQVNDVPDVPVAENQEVETEEDTAVAIALVASDADGDLLTFRIQRPPANGSLRGTPPDVSYLPDADYNGPDRFIFAADDGKGGIDTGTVSIEVRPADDVPVAADDEAVTDEGRVVDVAVLDNDRDPDGDPLRVVGFTQAANGSVVLNGDETIRYQAAVGFTGPDGFAYTIADAGGATATATVTVRVGDVPDVPVAENQTVETEEDTAVAIALVASDADGDPLTFRIQRPPVHGSLRGTPPDVSYLPDADYNGPDRFIFAADDEKGGIDTGTVSIEVRPVDDVPVAADDEAVTDEGSVVDVAVLDNDRDPDGDSLRVVGVTQAVHGWVVVNGDDTVRYQPSTGFAGSDGFAYALEDASGMRETAAVRVEVRPVADPR
jgi:uncharacterized protein YdeI (BOF family)